jgi:hypothetical protein
MTVTNVRVPLVQKNTLFSGSFGVKRAHTKYGGCGNTAKRGRPGCLFPSVIDMKSESLHTFFCRKAH